MLWVSISILLLTGIQIYVIGFGFSSIFNIVARILFLLRFKGILIPLKVIRGIDIAGIVLHFVYTILFRKPIIIDLCVGLLCMGLVFLVEILDDMFYLYITKDKEQDDE